MKIVSCVQGVKSYNRLNSAYVVDNEFARWACKNGHQMCVILPKINQFENVCHRLSIKIPSFIIFKKIYWCLISSIILLKFFKKDHNTIFRVNCFFSDVLSILPLMILTKYKAKIFIQFHHKDSNFLKNLFYSLVLPKIKLITCPSVSAMQELNSVVKRSFTDIIVVPHGVSTKYFSLNKIDNKNLTNGSQKLRLLYVGLLEERKNPFFLLDLSMVLKKKIPFILHIVGNGPLFAKLSRKLNVMGLTSEVVLTGEVSETEKEKLYSKADIFVFPSKQEGFGLVLCEALASGIAVVGFNTSTLPEIIDETCGILCDLNNVNQFSDEIIKLFQQNDRLKKLKKNAVKRAKEYFFWDDKVCTVLSKVQKTYFTKDFVSSHKFKKNKF